MARVRVYGSETCEDTWSTREFLDNAAISYQFIDIDSDRDAAAWVREQNSGRRKTPTVDVDGQILSVPTNEELYAALSASEARVHAP